MRKEKTVGPGANQIATGYVIPNAGGKHLHKSVVLTTTPKHGGLPRK
jgi:hypothetical protein